MCFKNANDFNKTQNNYAAEADNSAKKIMVCSGPGCMANGAQKISDRFREIIKEQELKDYSVESVRETGCHGFCQQGPLVAIEPNGTFYAKVKPKDVQSIIDEDLKANKVVQSLLYSNGNGPVEKYADIPFYKNQQRIALRNLGQIDQTSLKDYITAGGYRAMVKAITTLSPDDIIKEVTASALRGRGGGGFPAGRKWDTCRKVEADIRYVICNGDEGDPGAFMDRAIMEGDPHSVIEGMIICAFAIGTDQGFIYVRDEYPLAIVHLQKAIEDATKAGLLGDKILGTDFSLTIRINRGAGAFVCGESSALMKSIAGEVGEPRAKYVRSVVKGLHDKPTVLNNVETFANIPVIIDRGAKYFKSIGTEKSSGTKAFSLVGKVRNTGLIEVPMGTTLRTIIYEIGGGILDDRPFKAVQTGGPSGGCLPAGELDLPVDFDSLTEKGSMMGSGGMIVMDDDTCMIDVAKYFLSFLVDESCGKCVPCREGLYQLHRILVRISEGGGVEDDIEKMERLSKNIMVGSLCGLGTSGPNPLMSTLKYFKDEYIAHIRDKKCPAGVCKGLIRFDIIDTCTGCLACIPVCATNAITGSKDEIHKLEQDKCTQCGACYAVCNFDAITVS